MYRSTLSLTSALVGVGVQCHAPAALPQGKIRCPQYRKLDGLQGLSGGLRTLSPPPGFVSRIFEPITSRYTGNFRNAKC